MQYQPAFADEPDEIIGQSGEYQVRFGGEEDSMRVYRMTVDDLSYEKLVLTTKFEKECSMFKNGLGFTCSKAGSTPLAGATYRVTNDATPRCPGLLKEKRYTCVHGCKVSTPKYLSINPYEC
ncbi:MAG: hypothetical protein WBL28_05260 [Methylotenera sp.]